MINGGYNARNAFASFVRLASLKIKRSRFVNIRPRLWFVKNVDEVRFVMNTFVVTMFVSPAKFVDVIIRFGNCASKAVGELVDAIL
jgi:hypothetical protein